MKCRKCDREFLHERAVKEHMAVSHPKPVKTPKPPREPRVKKAKVIGNKWVRWEAGAWSMTKAYVKQLQLEGEDIAWDGLGNYMSERDLETAAMEIALGDDRLRDAGVPENFCTIRECVADCIYDGMLKGKKRVIAEGRNLDIKDQY